MNQEEMQDEQNEMTFSGALEQYLRCRESTLTYGAHWDKAMEHMKEAAKRMDDLVATKRR